MSQESLQIGIVQTDIYWENTIANLSNLEEKLANFDSKVDILVLPEMFATGFSPKSTHLAETMNGQIHRWMKMMAKKLNTVFVGSVLIQEKGANYNRILWVEPTGNTQTYDKKYLFSLAGEDCWLTAGKQRVVIHWKGWTIRPLICYDLRFPTWSWQDEKEIHDIILYVASWPAQRSTAWRTLLGARSIENQSYVVGVNRVGHDGLGNEYTGYSCAYSFKGEKMIEMLGESIQTITLLRSELQDFRSRYSFIRDGFK